MKTLKVFVEKVATGYKVVEIEQPSRRAMRKCLNNKYDDFWIAFENSETAVDNYHRYEQIMSENPILKADMEAFLNGSVRVAERKDQKPLKKYTKRKAKQAQYQ